MSRNAFQQLNDEMLHDEAIRENVAFERAALEADAARVKRDAQRIFHGLHLTVGVSVPKES